MKTPLVLLPAFLMCAVFVAVDLIAGVVLPMKHTEGLNVMVWAVAANVIVAFTMAFLASRTRWRGWRLALALSAVPFAVGVVNVVEGAVYLKSEMGHPAWILTFLAIKYGLTLPLWPLISRQAATPLPIVPALRSRTIGSKFWRFVLCDFLYLILYFIAGILIFPLVRDFYGTQPMPSIGQIVALQMLLRGPVFIVICVLLSCMIGAQRMATALAVGLAFTLISGVAPLIVPNPFFSDTVRWVHFCEVAGSNFVFGALVAFIWSKKPVPSHPAMAIA